MTQRLRGWRRPEFTMLVTIGYTGMRWGGTVDLERDVLRVDGP